jgi:hypothetical protein
VLTYDAATGALLAATPLDMTAIVVGRDGRLLGMTADTNGFHFGVVDFGSGTLQTLGTFRHPVVGIASRSSTYDPIRNLFYQPVQMTDGQPTLFGIDASTGTVSFSTPTEALSALKVDASGNLLGVVFSSAAWRISSIDPRSGESVPFSQAPIVQLPSGTAIDVEAGIFLVQTRDDVAIWAIDIATRDVQKLVTLERPLHALELIESCRSRR